MINTSFSSAITELLQDTCAKSLASTSGRDGIREIIETKNEYLICRFITDNLSQNMNIRYRELMTAKTEIRDVKSASPEALEDYKRKAQVFRDTVIATKMQLEECGYKVGEKDSLCDLCRYCDVVDKAPADVYSNFPQLTSKSEFDRALAPYGTTGAGRSLQQSMPELHRLNEGDWNNKNSRLYDCDFVKQLIVDAHNLVRSYEVEKQGPLSMDNPLMRLASFSGAVDDEQLESRIASEVATDHPVYAALHGYYCHADGTICNINEDDSNVSECLDDSEWLDDSSEWLDDSDGYCPEDMEGQEELDGEAGSESSVLRRPLPPQFGEDTTGPSQESSRSGSECRTIRTLPGATSSGLVSDERQDNVTDDSCGWSQRIWSRRGGSENDSGVGVRPGEFVLR